MPSTESFKREQENEDKPATFTNNDVFENPDKQLLTQHATVEDANGIERIVGPAATDFTPAPLEATDEQKKAAEEREGATAKAREARLSALKPAETNSDGSVKSAVKDEDRAPNVPGDGGSQTAPVEGDDTNKQVEERQDRAKAERKAREDKS